MQKKKKNSGTYWDKKTGVLRAAARPKQTLYTRIQVVQMRKAVFNRYKRTGRAKRDLIKVFIDWVLLVVRRLIIREPMFPRDAWPRTAGLSDPFDSCFLELRQLLRVETSPVERADASGGPVLAEAIDTLDSSCFRVVFGDSHVCA